MVFFTRCKKTFMRQSRKCKQWLDMCDDDDNFSSCDSGIMAIISFFKKIFLFLDILFYGV